MEPPRDDFEPEALQRIEPRYLWLFALVFVLLWSVIIAAVWGVWRAFHVG